jgi:hypothetical protein
MNPQHDDRFKMSRRELLLAGGSSLAMTATASDALAAPAETPTPPETVFKAKVSLVVNGQRRSSSSIPARPCSTSCAST